MKDFLTALLLCCSIGISAVDYCATASWGYAGTVTGGGNASPTLVKNISELTAALSGTNQKVVIITQNIEFTHRLSVEVSNLTLMALPGVKLYSNKRYQEDSGILIIKGNSTNVILRNLTFEGPGAYDCDGYDNLSLEGVSNIWVDHCDFQDGMDGNFDIKQTKNSSYTTDNITVTWCRFRYLKAPKAGGSGGSADHRFSNLIGSDSDNKPIDGCFNITYGYCWWDEGCKQRMTRCRNSELHFLNCYWNSSVADYYVGPENAKCYFEGCTFEGNANYASGIWSEFNGSTNYCQFVKCSGNLPYNTGGVSAPSYSYDKLSAANAKQYVTNSTCGAGATLNVTTYGEVSSSCTGEEPEDPEEQGSMTWNISDNAFNSLGTISSEKTINGLHIVATDAKTIIVDAVQAPVSIDEYELSHRLKLGGAGTSTYRHLWFNVTGNCTITVYLASSGSEERVLNIDKGDFGNTITTLAAPESVAKKTYNYTGNAAKLFLYSTNKGINIYGINIVYSGSATSIETPPTKNAARKVLRDGRILIIRDGKTYNVLGLNQ